jgi:hypothetical protein
LPDLIGKAAKIPKNESEGNIHTSPVVRERLINRNGSYGGSPSKDISEKIATPKTPNRNSSLNSLFFWKASAKKVSPNGSKSSFLRKSIDDKLNDIKSNDGKSNDSKSDDNDVILTKTPLPEQLVSN